MTAPTSRGERARTWLSRIAFGASILALLGTSRPTWSIPAALPDSGVPRSGTAVRVTVDASSSPSVRYTNRLGIVTELSWARTNDNRPTKASYLLPPGAALYSVDIRGHECGSGGACTKCMPPPGAFVRASGEVVHVWTKLDTLETKLEAPLSVASNVPRVEIVVAGEPRNVEVVLRGKTDRDHLGTWQGTPVPVQCRAAPDEAGTDAVCSHFIYSEQRVEANVVVEVTSFGECADPQRPCATPEGGTRIRSVVLREGP